MISTYSSPLLFHGPGARASAMGIVPELGRLLIPPMGDDGFKINDVREVVEILGKAPIGDRAGVVVLGPMCKATATTSDVLLKILEEYQQEIVRPVLWALSEADVRPTIKSRCLLRWCPGTDSFPVEFVNAAKTILTALPSQDWATVIEEIGQRDPLNLLRGVAVVLSQQPNSKFSSLWERVRLALTIPNLSALELLAVFLEEASP